jgi:hypothetical protein|tara:strand:+ start:3925 stop:4734 length:810 start_codon:yes stop_codon:yes gene_type:complete
MKKTITLRRKELMNHLPKEVRLSAKARLGSVYVGRQPLKGVKGDEEKSLLNGVLDVEPTHSDWPKHSKKFWAELSINVPFEGVTLDVSLDEHGDPVNLDDYIKYTFIKKHPHVSKSKDEMTSSQRFFIHDQNRETLKKHLSIQKRKDADREFIKVTSDISRLRNVLRVMSPVGSGSPDKLNNIQAENALYELKEKEPAQFIKIATDKNLDVRAEIDEFISAEVLRRIGNQIIYIDDVIGEDTDDAIVYLKNKKNSSVLTTLRAKLKELV